MRIVGGQFRGRPLAAPGDDAHAARPPTACARRCSISSRTALPTSRSTAPSVLDLFAGTGALGLEALSRGAAFCLFVEEEAEARALIRRNVEAFGLTGVTKIFRRDATDLGPAGRQRRLRARLPRSALRPGPRRAGARLGGGGRLARAGRHRRHRGAQGRGHRAARRLRRSSTSAPGATRRSLFARFAGGEA